MTKTGFEPVRACAHCPLKTACLPFHHFANGFRRIGRVLEYAPTCGSAPHRFRKHGLIVIPGGESNPTTCDCYLTPGLTGPRTDTGNTCPYSFGYKGWKEADLLPAFGAGITKCYSYANLFNWIRTSKTWLTVSHAWYHFIMNIICQHITCFYCFLFQKNSCLLSGNT